MNACVNLQIFALFIGRMKKMSKLPIAEKDTKCNFYCSALRASHPQGGICTRKVGEGERCWQHKGKQTWSLEQIGVGKN